MLPSLTLGDSNLASQNSLQATAEDPLKASYCHVMLEQQQPLHCSTEACLGYELIPSICRIIAIFGLTTGNRLS